MQHDYFWWMHSSRVVVLIETSEYPLCFHIKLPFLKINSMIEHNPVYQLLVLHTISLTVSNIITFMDIKNMQSPKHSICTKMGHLRRYNLRPVLFVTLTVSDKSLNELVQHIQQGSNIKWSQSSVQSFNLIRTIISFFI